MTERVSRWWFPVALVLLIVSAPVQSRRLRQEVVEPNPLPDYSLHEYDQNTAVDAQIVAIVTEGDENEFNGELNVKYDGNNGNQVEDTKAVYDFDIQQISTEAHKNKANAKLSADVDSKVSNLDNGHNQVTALVVQEFGKDTSRNDAEAEIDFKFDEDVKDGRGKNDADFATTFITAAIGQKTLEGSKGRNNFDAMLDFDFDHDIDDRVDNSWLEITGNLVQTAAGGSSNDFHADVDVEIERQLGKDADYMNDALTIGVSQTADGSDNEFDAEADVKYQNKSSREDDVKKSANVGITQQATGNDNKINSKIKFNMD